MPRNRHSRHLAVALPAALLLAAPSLGAQRALAAAGVAPAAHRAPTSTTPWDSLTPGERDFHRALWATGGGLVGFGAGFAVGLAIASGDHRASDQRELDGLAVIALAAVGETIAVAAGAASPGGRGTRACTSSVRTLRSFAGTLAGTGAMLLLGSKAPVAYALLPVGQVTGAVIALGGC